MKLKPKEPSTLNNKGQVLVAFILLLPLIFIIIASVLDFGLLSIEKRQITNSVNEALKYASSNKQSDILEDEISMMLNKNIKNINTLNTVKESDYFEIDLTCNLSGIFSNILKDKYSYTIIKRIKY
jgi:uncharacterized protein (UPF0333 family)